MRPPRAPAATPADIDPALKSKVTDAQSTDGTGSKEPPTNGHNDGAEKDPADVGSGQIFGRKTTTEEPPDKSDNLADEPKKRKWSEPEEFSKNVFKAGILENSHLKLLARATPSTATRLGGQDSTEKLNEKASILHDLMREFEAEPDRPKR